MTIAVINQQANSYVSVQLERDDSDSGTSGMSSLGPDAGLADTPFGVWDIAVI